jgi:phosphate uptake regulator
MSPVSILDLIKQNSWSNDLVAKIDDMLELTAEMFGYAVEIIIYGEQDDDPPGEIYDRNQQVVQLQREIRRQVITHLASKPAGSEIPPGFSLLNAVGDIVQMGDTMESFYKLHALMPDAPDLSLYQEYLVGRSRTIEDLFGRISQALAESNTETAQEVIDRAQTLGTQADEAVREITRAELGVADAVCLALSMRCYQRTAVLMSKLLTSVVLPADLQA